MNKANGRQHAHRKVKRATQNRRTFLSVTKRRENHANNHGITVASLGAKRWTSPPTSKN